MITVPSLLPQGIQGMTFEALWPNSILAPTRECAGQAVCQKNRHSDVILLQRDWFNVFPEQSPVWPLQ